MAKQEEQKVDAVRLPPFQAATSCPKCGQKMGIKDMRYSAVSTERRVCREAGKLNVGEHVLVEEHEFLKATCPTCGYWWLTACADRSGPKPEAKP